MLGTTPTTFFKESDVTIPLDKIEGPELLANAEKAISVNEFKFVDIKAKHIHYLPNKNMLATKKKGQICQEKTLYSVHIVK